MPAARRLGSPDGGGTLREIDDVARDRADVLHETVIAAGNLDEPGPFREAAGIHPALPRLSDVIERNALVVGSHHEDHGYRRGLRVLTPIREVLEEPAVNREVPALRVVEKDQRISGRQLLRPPSTETDRRRDEDERSPRAQAGHLESDNGTEGAPDDHRGRMLTRFFGGETRDRSKVELAEGRHVQVGSDDVEAVRGEEVPQRPDLPARRRRSETVEVEDLFQRGRRINSPQTGGYMPRPMTRRLAAKLLLAVPAALAAPALVAKEPAPKGRRSPTLSLSEKRQLEKSVAQFRSLAAKVREMKIPIGTEPAFIFRPLASKK